jgi:hypothetical protein
MLPLCGYSTKRTNQQFSLLDNVKITALEAQLRLPKSLEARKATAEA